MVMLLWNDRLLRIMMAESNKMVIMKIMTDYDDIDEESAGR